MLVCTRSRPIPIWPFSISSFRHGAGFDIVSGGESSPAFWRPEPTPTRSSSPASARPLKKCASPWRRKFFCFNVESAAEPTAQWRCRQSGAESSRESRQPDRPKDSPLYFHRPQGSQIRRRLWIKPGPSTAVLQPSPTSALSVSIATSVLSFGPRPLFEALDRILGTDRSTGPPTASLFIT